MFLIMSGAFVGQELESEFGKIPPSFLPLGNKRLYQYQIALAPKGEDIYISIPETFNISITDQVWLEKNNVNIIKTPNSLSLGASLVASLNISGNMLNKPLHVLFGDTLFRSLPIGENIVGISYTTDYYNWAVLTNDNIHWLKDHQSESLNTKHRIIDGYFKFNNPRELIKSITQSEWQFLEGLNKYHNTIGITPIESDSWLDFGHVNTYYHSKAQYTTQRAFNELLITPDWVEKSSAKSHKIAAEAFWFENLPSKLRGFTPQYLGSKYENGTISYRLEFLHLTALNELYVFSRLPSKAWEQILTSCINFLIACNNNKASDYSSANSLPILLKEKTIKRLNDYCRDKNISFDKKWSLNGSEGFSLTEVLENINMHVPSNPKEDTVLHGDFCFSNILYDFRAGKIKTIDPRGLTPSNEQTIYGDLRYDLAKLSHSVLGLYDWIIAGYFDVAISSSDISFNIVEEDHHKETQKIFIKMVEDTFGLTAKELYAMQIHLFLSMLPLHSDDVKRQEALFANAFRLHQIFLRLK
ncbi:capsular biosynthesis protein [Providencia sp. wls1922]|uniref:capsular biosynthesis protein n=1 Tax=Providencia sp. wls1922 TaxID=2675152 RepID=UPI0012B54E5D|nr:capsular biosynthesis protein [Providencia sp. wls1922]MTC47095.1 capsular biosynthesis protein [Providencia sp. wls1922]